MSERPNTGLSSPITAACREIEHHNLDRRAFGVFGKCKNADPFLCGSATASITADEMQIPSALAI